MTKPPVDILITTYPQKKSRNVGDNLICQSALKLIKSRNPNYNPVTVFREDSLDGFSKNRTRSVVAPGFSVSNDVYPTLCKLYTDNARLRNFFPIGCSFQNVIPSEDVFYSAEYNENTLSFLKEIASRFGPIPCRDQLIVNRLEHFKIPATYSGDLVLFDEDIIGTPFKPPSHIKSVVFTVQHHLHYLEQSILLLKEIKNMFPDAKRYIAFHSVPGFTAQTIAARGQQLGYETLHQYGDVSNLDRYDNIDLHIGYRLHGHITFLRKRKPSILMVEDARAYGFSKTKGTSHGCIEAYNTRSMEPDMQAPCVAMDFLHDQIKTKFLKYHDVFNFIDKTFRGKVDPLFLRIASATMLKKFI